MRNENIEPSLNVDVNEIAYARVESPMSRAMLFEMSKPNPSPTEFYEIISSVNPLYSIELSLPISSFVIPIPESCTSSFI